MKANDNVLAFPTIVSGLGSESFGYALLQDLSLLIVANYNCLWNSKPIDRTVECEYENERNQRSDYHTLHYRLCVSISAAICWRCAFPLQSGSLLFIARPQYP